MLEEPIVEETVVKANFVVTSIKRIKEWFSWVHITRRDILIFLTGMMVMGYCSYHVYAWRINEAKQIGAMLICEKADVKQADGTTKRQTVCAKYNVKAAGE